MTDLSFQDTRTGLPVSEWKTLQAVRCSLSTVLLVLRDCRNGLLGTGIAMGRAYEMIYVEPYQADRRDDESNPDHW